MTRRASRLLHIAVAAIVFAVTANGAAAQSAQSSTPASDKARPYLGVGVMATSFHAECCGRIPDQLRHGTGITVDLGMALNPRADVGARVMLTPAGHDEERMHSRAILAVAKYRFWPSRGFFVSGGLGMAWVSDAVDLLSENPGSASSKGLAVEMRGGWEWRLHRHLSLQAFGSQYVVTLGDLQTPNPDVSIDNLIINHWSLGVSFVLR